MKENRNYQVPILIIVFK